METSRWQRLEALFAEAIELPHTARGAFVERRCGDDLALREELRTLLDAHATEDGLLDRPPSRGVATGAAVSETLPEGTRIGAWRVGALIGIGGSGEVYFATRADGGFEQLAALKRLYRDAAPDLLRFAAERQILASLEHPGIARLLDGGVASDGRLYAVGRARRRVLAHRLLRRDPAPISAHDSHCSCRSATSWPTPIATSSSIAT